MFVCIYVLHTLPRSGSSAHTGCLGEAAPRLRPAEESEPGLLTGHWIHQESLPFSRFPVTLNAMPPTSPLPIHGPQRCPRGVQLVTEVFSVADLVPTDTWVSPVHTETQAGVQAQSIQKFSVSFP